MSFYFSHYYAVIFSIFFFYYILLKKLLYFEIKGVKYLIFSRDVLTKVTQDIIQAINQKSDDVKLGNFFYILLFYLH